jgi:putative ABC transport system permease protein
MISDMVKIQLKRHKLRTGLTILGVVIGILLITTLASFSEGMRVSINENIGVIEGKIYIVKEGTSITSFGSASSAAGSQLDESLVDDISQVSGVRRVVPFLITSTPEGMVAGFPPDALDILDYDVGFDSGGMYESGTNEMALGPIAADRLGVVVGDVVRIQGKDMEVVGISESLGNPEDDNSLWTSVENAQEIGNLEGKVTLMIVEPYVLDDTELLARQISEDFDDIDAVSDKEAVREIQELISQINVMIYSVGGIASVIAAIVIMNVMFMSVSERTREIGTMKALGATNFQIISEVVGESIFIAFIGGLIGIGLSFIGVYYLNQAIGTPGFARITVRLFVQSLSFAVLLGLVGGILPARKAAKMDPIVALRYE